jgi:hypothetical protein
MMFILPIGILIYFWDKRNYRQSLELFEGYIVKMKHADLDDSEKMEKVDSMFYENGYKIVQRETTHLVVEKKHFNIGILLIMFGLFNYFGLFGYVLFYKFFLKPRRLRADIGSDEVLSAD